MTFKTSIFFKNSAQQTIKSYNFYGESSTEIKKREITYYGFNFILGIVKKHNPLIPSFYFETVPIPIAFLPYPLYFESFFKKVKDKFNHYNLFIKLIFYFFYFVITNFNMSSYVRKDSIFTFRTFNGFNFVSLWYNFHFFLPFTFGFFSKNEIEGTFYDISFPTIATFRQRFCNFFYNRFSNYNKFAKFIIIYFFIFFIPFFLFFSFFFIFFFSPVIFFIFFIFWRDQLIIKNNFSNISNFSFITFEFWNPVNYFWFNVYYNYISSFIFFCQQPSFFNGKFSALYPHVVNRVYFYTFRYYFTFFINFIIKFFYFIFNSFGFFNFSKISEILNNPNYTKLFSSNNTSNIYDKKIIFDAYINSIDFLKSKKYFFDFRKSIEFKNDKNYKDSIFSWPKIKIDNIGKHKHMYYNYHFSKYNIDFSFDISRFPYIDPDFVHFYAKELSNDPSFVSCFSKHDISKLYSFHVFKTAKSNKFNTQKIWNVFFSERSVKDKTFYVQTSYYSSFLESAAPKVSYLYSKFGLVFIPELSIFHFFYKIPFSIFYFLSFLFYFFDSFFIFTKFFTFIKYVKNFVKRFIFLFFCDIYFFFLSSVKWSFIPFFDYFKNFYIHFYTFYIYTTFIRNFYFERSVNKTFFMESLEETDDEETHFTDTVEQSNYLYWFQDFEIDIDCLNFFHDEVYDQFTDVFDYDDDELDYLNTLYQNDDDVDVSHFDFEVDGLENFRDSTNYFEDENDQEDFEDTYEDLEQFFSPVEDSYNEQSDYLFYSIFLLRRLIYDVSDIERNGPRDFFSTGYGPYSAFEHDDASYDIQSALWRQYFYYYWGSNVPINEDHQTNINHQLQRYTNYLDKWHKNQLNSGKYIKIPNVIRSFGKNYSLKTEFSKNNFEKLTIKLNNAIFPRSKLKKIYFSDQIEIIWDKIGKIFSEKPEYVINILEKPEFSDIFTLISKNSFEIRTKKNINSFFYYSEKIFFFIFNIFSFKTKNIKNEKEFVRSFFGQFHDFSNIKNFNIPSSTIKNVLEILNRINSNKNDEFYYINKNNFEKTNFNKFKFIKISFFKIIFSLFIIKFIRITELDKVNEENLKSYIYLINLFSSIQFGNFNSYYIYLKYIIKSYLMHHSHTGEFSIIISKEQVYKEVLDYGAHNHVLGSFNILADLGLFWKDLVPNIKKVYENWNDPLLASFFFPEHFYVILDYSYISTFDDEQIDIYEEQIDYLTELNGGDLLEDPYEVEAGPTLEDTDADPDEEVFYRSEGLISTVLYEDLSDEDDEYFYPDIHWYEQIEDEPEYDEWELDFFDEIEDINIPIERIFFGEFYRNFINRNIGNNTGVKESVVSSTRTTFYSYFKKDNNKCTKNNLINFVNKSNTKLTIPRINDTANIFFEKTKDSYTFSSNSTLFTKKNFGIFYFFVVRVIKYFLYIYYYLFSFIWTYSINKSCSIRKPLSSLEKEKIFAHYKKFKHLYNKKFFMEFKVSIVNWLKTYESINSKSRLEHTTFEIIRSNIKLDHSVNSPLYTSPFSFSWFKEPTITNNFSWELDEFFKEYFNLDLESPRVDADYTNLIDDFISDFSNDEEIKKISEEDAELYEDAHQYGLFLLSTFFLNYEDAELYTEKFIYHTLISMYFLANKKNALHTDLYTQDIYKIFEDDWISIQNEIGFYKEDASAWLNILDNAPEDDYIEDPISPFYVSEEEILHSSKEYSNKFFIIVDSVWEFFVLIIDYHIYWFRLVINTYIISYFTAISAYSDKKWLELSITYGFGVYIIRSFFSFSFLLITSLYIVFIVPRIVFIITNSYFSFFISIFTSGIISFFLILLVVFFLFSSVYDGYKDINEYERSTFFFGAFISWFTVVWYSIIENDLYNNEENSNNAYPSLDPDPILAPDSATLEIGTPEVIDLDPTWFYYEGSSFKPTIALQPVTFGYFIDVFFSQYVNVANRSLTGYKFRDRLHNDIISESISNYVTYLRQKENVKDTEAFSSSGRYASERGISDTARDQARITIIKTASKKRDWINKYSDLRYVSQRSTKLYTRDADGIIGLDFEWNGADPLYGQKHFDPEEIEDFIYRGRKTYSRGIDNSRFFVRNYYDNFEGDKEITVWNIHYRPYDWFASSYLSNGFFKSIKKYKPFNYNLDLSKYFKSRSIFRNIYFSKVNYADYKLPFDKYFSQKFVYGSSEYHYKPKAIMSSYSENNIKTFRRFNYRIPTYNSYITSLSNKSINFNFLKDQAYQAHFKYFYFNRFRYYVSKFNPNSIFFSRTGFSNVGGWPSENSNKLSIDIYYNDYPLFIENMKYKLIGYSDKLKMARHYYYLSLSKPPIISIFNLDFFNWFFSRLFPYKTTTLSYSQKFNFFFQKIVAYISSKSEEELKNKLFNIEKNIYQVEQSFKYSFFWNFFWIKTTSKTFDENIVALPSTALLINPNYLPKSYINSLSIRRFHLDSTNFNSRLFSRKQFKRFWYKSAFVSIIDENPIRFSEQFHNFKAYESGIPISPTFYKVVKDPISKVIKRGIRKPIFKENYNNYIKSKYYKKILNFINSNKKVDVSSASFEFGFDAYNNFYPFYNNIFNSFFINENFKIKSIKSRVSLLNKKNIIIRYFYKKNLFNNSIVSIYKNENFFKGRKSSFYINQVYRYPFSRSISRLFFDAINSDEYTRFRFRPGYSTFVIYNGINYIPYDYRNKFNIPYYSKTPVVNEDLKPALSNYLKKRFDRGYSTFSRIVGDPIENHELFQTSAFKWSGRHTGGFNKSYIKNFRYPSWNQNHDFKITSNIFNKFPFINSKLSYSAKYNFYNFFSKLAQDESNAILYYTTEYEWPGSTKIQDYYSLSYPYSTITDGYYETSSSILHGKNLHTFVHDLELAQFLSVEQGDEISEEIVSMRTKKHIISGAINEYIRRQLQFVFDIPLDNYNLINSVNLGLKQPIEVFSLLDPYDSSNWAKTFNNAISTFNFKNSSKNKKFQYVNKFNPNFITTVEDEQRLEKDFGGESVQEETDTSVTAEIIIKMYNTPTNVKGKTDVNDVLSSYISGFDRTPIYSKNYSKGFQKKESFFSLISNTFMNNFLNNVSINVSNCNTYNFQNNFYKKILETKSPLEKYIYNSYNYTVNYYSHKSFPFSEKGKLLNNIISTRRTLYRSRILARLNKYIYASAFEKTYNRVFSGSRVPIIDVNPFNVMLDEKDKINTFEIWADSTQNEILMFAKGDDEDEEKLKNISLDENSVKIDIESFDDTKKVSNKYVSTYKLNSNRKNKILSTQQLSFVHNNLGELLFQRLKRSRLNNFKYMSNDDVAFIHSNAKLLRKRSKKFMSSEVDLFTRQTPNSIDYYRYIANKEFELSEKYRNEVTKMRKELNKIRPGHIYKDTFSGD